MVKLLKRKLKFCNISLKYVKCLLVLVTVIYILTEFCLYGNSYTRHPRNLTLWKIPVNGIYGINGFVTNKTSLEWKASVQEYYKSHYGNCQFSVVKDKKISCKNILDTGKGLTVPQDKTRLCNLTKISENCELFRQINGYDNKYITNEELYFPLAFGIRLHGLENQAEQLLRTIYRPHNFYCLHVDKHSNSTKTYQHLKSVAKCFDNIIVLSEIRTVYSSIKLVNADLLCMKKALNSKIKWKYYLNMAGSEMPIKTNLEIVKICKILKGRNDIESQPMSEMNALRYSRKFNITNDSIINNGNKDKPFQYKIAYRKGSAYGLLSRNFTTFVLTNQLALSFLDYLKDTYAPEETYFPSLNFLYNAPGGYNVTVKHSNLNVISRIVLWKWDNIVCNGTLRHYICVFNSKALKWLTSRPEVIVNKVLGRVDQVIIDCLEEYLFNRSRDQIPFQTDIYKHYPHIVDLYSESTSTLTRSVGGSVI